MRFATFIDGGYMDKILQHEFNKAHIDYGKLSKHINRHIGPNIELLRTYYYHCLPYQSNPPTPEEQQRFGRKQSFFASLDRLPRFEVRRGELARRSIGGGKYRYEQKLVDVLFSVDLVELSTTGSIQHAALIAGDSDFCPAVKVAKSKGVLIWLFHGRRPHNKLWDMADERVPIDKNFIDAILR